MPAELPPLDPDLAESLDAIPDEYLVTNVVDFEDLPAARARLAELTTMLNADAPDRPGVETTDRTVTVPGGDRTIRLRVHRPVDAPASASASEGATALPCVYWIHGGGTVVGRPEADDPACRRLVDELGCVVVAVEYRLAPEHPYPPGRQSLEVRLR
jgi:acetyl esterase/lipase